MNRLRLQGFQQKVNWFSSIPEKYRNEIMDRLNHDKLRIDDPSCSQYQIVLDLMGKDDSTLARDKIKRDSQFMEEQYSKQIQEKRAYEEGQASAYLVEDGQKQLLFTVPEHQKPKFLSKTSLLQQLLAKETEQLGFMAEDNNFIFTEIMKNEIIAEEFNRIRETFGEEAYELNKISLLNFIKKGRQNFTYSVKYYGIDEGQIGILSRKVPYDLLAGGPVKLPRIVEKTKRKPEYLYEEVEYSEDEVIEVEVTDDEDDVVPVATKPTKNFDIVQGSVAGTEFKGLKKDSAPIDRSKNSPPRDKTPPKKMKKIKKTQRVKRKRIIKKLKPQPIEETLPEQPSKTVQNQSRRIQPEEIIVTEKDTPYLINFRELFKKCELSNLKDYKKPEPERYDNHIVHSYSLPKGLHALKRQQVLSEAELYDKERYSKRNIQLHMIDKGQQKMNLGGQTYGLKGSKVKPIYFPFTHQPASGHQSALSQHSMNTGVENSLMTMPLKSMVTHGRGTIEHTQVGTASSQMQMQPVLQDHTGQQDFQVQQTSTNLDAEPVKIPEELQDSERSQNQMMMNQYMYIDPRPNLNFNSNEVSQIKNLTTNVNVSKMGLGSQSITLLNNQNSSAYPKAQNQASRKNNQIIKQLARGKKKADMVSDGAGPHESNSDLASVGIFDQRDLKAKKGLARNASEGTLQFGFQISNQMKVSYLMDTKKLLERKPSKKTSQVDSDDEEDGMIFAQQPRPVALPRMPSSGKLSLPLIKNHPNITGSQYEVNQSLLIVVICRIRPPQIKSQLTGARKDKLQSPCTTLNQTYSSLRHKSRSKSRDLSSPFSNLYSQLQGTHAALRNTSREESGYNSSSSSKSIQISYKLILERKTKKLNSSGELSKEDKYCLFSTKERSNIVVASENAIPGKLINESLQDTQDLNYFKQTILGEHQCQTFQFDSVFNETTKQDRFYRAAISPLVKSFVEGENATVLLFGPTDGGKTFTLKGKTGVERGILPRAIEDIFSIIKSSEQRVDDQEDVYKSHDTFGRGDYEEHERDIPERSFLKIQVYQIITEKIIDLLAGNQMQGVKIDQYIDHDSREVVSRVKNVSEKAVFSLEDFYSVLQEAFKNRRQESDRMSEKDLRKKAHFVVGIKLMKRDKQRKLMELSELNFVELTGSEQAVAEDKFINNSSVKQFVTKSFNAVSSSILKSALKKKQNIHQEGDVKLIDCIRSTLSNSSNIVLICNVNPSQSHYEHSLPAIKFCSRIHDLIMKKSTKGDLNQSKDSISKSSSIEEVNYSTGGPYHQSVHHSHNYHTDTLPRQRSNYHQTSQDNNRSTERSKTPTSNDTIREIVDHMKEELAMRQIKKREVHEFHDQEKWVIEKLQVINKLSSRIEDQDVPRQISEKEKALLKQELDFLREGLLRLRYQAPKVNDIQILSPRENSRGPREIEFSSTQTYRCQNPLNSERLSHFERPDRGFPNRQSIQRREDRTNLNYETQYNRKDYILTQDQELDLSYSQRDSASRNDIVQDHTPSFQSEPSPANHRGERVHSLKTRLQPHHIGKQQERQSSRQQSTSSKAQPLNHEMKSGYSRSRQDSNYMSSRTSKVTESSRVISENDYLNKHPYLDKTLHMKTNSISNENSPAKETQQNAQPSQVIGNRSRPAHHLNFQHSQQSLDPLSQPISHQQSTSSMVINLNQVPNTQAQTNPEYIKNPFQTYQGTNLRNNQKKVERQEQLEEENQAQEDAIEEQEDVIREAQQEFQNTIDELNSQKLLNEQSNTTEAYNTANHLIELQQKINDLERLLQESQRAQDEAEKIALEHHKDKEIAEMNFERMREENTKLRQNYDILKEHEINIIKDNEGKKNKEISFFEQRMAEMSQQVKEEQQRQKECEQIAFQAREEMRRIHFENEKLLDDRKQLTQRIEDLQSRAQQDDDARNDIQKQLTQIEQQYQKVEEQRDLSEQEKRGYCEQMEKLHRLIEEMDHTIDKEKEVVRAKVLEVQEKESIIMGMQREQDRLLSILSDKDSQIEEAKLRREELERQLSQLGQVNEGLEKQLILIKSREFDKVEILKQGAEIEARLIHLQADNENLVRERNNLDIANVNLNLEKQQLEQQLGVLEQELDYFRRAHEEHLDKFDYKFELISSELMKLKTENIALKERDRNNRGVFRDVEEERDELKDKLRTAERKNDELSQRLQELERDVKGILGDRERDIKESQARTAFGERFKDENKTKVLEDIQNMIRNYKYEKNMGRSSLPLSQNNYSTHSSGYYQ